MNTRLCLSMSDYHPESWNPVWSVSCILTGALKRSAADWSSRVPCLCRTGHACRRAALSALHGPPREAPRLLRFWLPL